MKYKVLFLSLLKLHYILSCFCLIFISSAMGYESNSAKQVNKLMAKPLVDITGIWHFISSQPQESSIYQPLESMVIIKFFQQGRWIHTAYQANSKKAVFIAGGRYSFDGKQLIEIIDYHSKDSNAIGITTYYQVTFDAEILQVSGVYRVANSTPWKVEEYWRVEQSVHEFR